MLTTLGIAQWVVLAAAGKAFLLTLLTGGGFGAFILFFFIFKMLGK